MTDQTSAIVTVEDVKATVRTVRLPRLNAAQLEQAKKLMPSLRPTPQTIYEAVSLSQATAARGELTGISTQMLDGVTLKDMQQANLLADRTMSYIDELNVEDLNPEPRQKQGWFFRGTESIKDVIKRVENFFKRYQQVNAQINRVLAEVGVELSNHSKTHQQLIKMYERNWALMDELRIAYAACKLFLDSPDGYTHRDELNDLALKEVEAATAEGRDPDQVVIRNADEYTKYIERVEMYATMLSQAVVDAYQKSVAIAMLRDNELIIQQGLSNLIDPIIPGWRDMLALGWAAYQANGAVAFINRLRATDASIRDAKARMIGTAAGQVAQLKKQQAYDPESMQRLNTALIEALNVLRQASIEGAKVREATEELNQELILELSEVVAKQISSDLAA